MRIDNFEQASAGGAAAAPPAAGEGAAVPQGPSQAAEPASGYGVQLGAFSSADRANAEWAQLKAVAAGTLDGLEPRVVVGEHGWWQGCAALGAPAYDPFEREGANYNLLIGSDTLDPISGTASHRAYLCEIRPVA